MPPSDARERISPVSSQASAATRPTRAFLVGVAAGVAVWVVLIVAVMIAGPRGFDPYPE